MKIVADPELLGYAGRCVEIASVEFAITTLPAPFLLVTGGSLPEFRMQPGHGTAVILDENAYSWPFQIGHEVSHWLITPAEAAPGILHWTHEWLAIETSLTCLRTCGLNEQADTHEAWLESEVGTVSSEAVLTEPLTHPYADRYGRIVLLGRELRSVVGMEHAKRLATFLDDEFKVDLAGWVDSLPHELAAGARLVLRVPEEDWV